MKWMEAAWNRLRLLIRRDAVERRLDEEMRFHVDRLTDRNLRAGMDAQEARRQALLTFGGIERVRDMTRDEIRPRLLDDAVRDVRHGVRLLARSPGFTAAALLTLALGIGATAAIFSIVRTVVLEPLPYRDPGRLVAVCISAYSAAQRLSVGGLKDAGISFGIFGAASFICLLLGSVAWWYSSPWNPPNQAALKRDAADAVPLS